MSGKKKFPEISELKRGVEELIASFNVLFQRPENGRLVLVFTEFSEFLGTYNQFLESVLRELRELEEDPSAAGRIRLKLESEADSVDCFNYMMELCRDTGFKDMLNACLLEVLTAGRLFSDQRDPSDCPNALVSQVMHARRLSRDGVLFPVRYWGLLRSLDKPGKSVLFRLIEFDESAFDPDDVFGFKGARPEKKCIDLIREAAQKYDPFRTERVFRYSAGEFIPSELGPIRAVEDFYGYPDARKIFADYYGDFVRTGKNHPLLISSLPGLGKTHFAISYCLAQEELTLILPEPSDLERDLVALLGKLKRRKNRRFVLFYDDIDARKVDWYYFRMNVGGSFVLPENIAIVIASNHEFPANILSRGRGYTFPIFDEIMCQEMVLDFLKSFGMKNPSEELASVISADYVEEFGQHFFEELSPRTLVRYLDRYNSDMKKRERMLTLSREDVIARPDSEVFYEANRNVIERLKSSI